jgi:Meiotically up-regulated gene 113
VLRTASPPRLTNEDGFVYFLRAGERVKIGFSKRPWLRWGELSTGLSHNVTPMAFVPGTQREERRAHWFLNRYRQAGEWFDCHPNVMKVVFRSLTFGKVTLDESAAEEDREETNSVALRHIFGISEATDPANQLD